MQKRKFLTIAIILFNVVLLLSAQKSYFANAHTNTTSIPNCIPYTNLTDASYNVHIYPDKNDPTISIDIQPQDPSSNDIVCKVPLCGRYYEAYSTQVLCNVDGIQIIPQISFSKNLIKPIELYTYQEILNTELQSVSIPEEISIIKYTFSSPSSGSITFIRPTESKLFREFHSHSYESATNRFTVKTSTQKEFFYTFGRDIQDLDCVNTEISRQETTLNDFIDELTSFSAELLSPKFPISTLEHFYRSKLYECLNSSAIMHNFEEILLPVQSYGFIFYNFVIPIESKPTTIQIEMPLNTTTNTLYDPSIENFSVLFNNPSDFSLFIETNKKLVNNKYFQEKTNGYEFIGQNTNQFTLDLCESETPNYKFEQNNKLTDLQIILIILSGITVFCGIIFLIFFLNKALK